MKFAHLADCHLGGWRDPKMRQVNVEAFIRAIDICVKEEVDFVLIAGDLFNTSLPALDVLKVAVGKLRGLRQKNIPVYVVAGSHDYSPSGKSMLEVLEEAELLHNVVKGSVENNQLKLRFTVDKMTGAKITGLLGRKGSLEQSYYASLDRASLEKEDGFKIFVFHMALDELKKERDKMLSAPISLFPKGFAYYAGGHVHARSENFVQDYGLLTYPGPLFPNTFGELEELRRGGFYIYDEGKLDYRPIEVYPVTVMDMDGDGKTAQEIEADLLAKTDSAETSGRIVLIRLHGTLSQGKPSDIRFHESFAKLYINGAYFVMRSTTGLSSQEFEEIKVEKASVGEVEKALVKEHLGKIPLPGKDEEATIIALMEALDREKQDDERRVDFEARLAAAADQVLGKR